MRAGRAPSRHLFLRHDSFFVSNVWSLHISQGDSFGGTGVEQRFASIESAVDLPTHFITRDMRPDQSAARAGEFASEPTRYGKDAQDKKILSEP